jgi:hypothetical protein
MDWVVDGIAIGGLRDVMNHEMLRGEGIEALLQLGGSERERPSDPLPPYLLAALPLPVMDARALPPELLRQGLDFIGAQRAQDRKVLVACGAGISRSAAFVVAYLHEQGMEIDEALRTVIREHPVALPHPALLRSLIEYYQLPRTVPELLTRIVRLRKELRGEPVVRWLSGGEPTER